MEVIRIKLKDLKEPERNVRMHTDQQLREFERSVKMFGQIRPIVVDENNVIMAGCGLYQTLLRMGKNEADCYKIGDLTENQKKKLMIADNKIFNLGVEDLQTLTAFLEEMDGDLDIPGFDEDILHQMMADAEEVTGKISEYGTLDESTIAEIRERGERQEAKISENGPGTAEEGEDSEDADGEGGETAEMKRYVLCPNCGEKIWL